MHRSTIRALHRLLPAAALLLSLFCPLSAAADGWHARIPDDAGTPRRLVAVDKEDQKLHIYERHSPLKLAASYVCTTGQATGDKQTAGDLKTPEGIYFVVNKLSAGLDMEMYGGIAYTLNYPNPVDKLRRKTGSGIWIHSKGHDIVPRETKGCIALNRADIDKSGKLFVPGTPVAVAGDVSTDASPPKEDKATARKLEDKVKGWAKAWGSRSPAMFDYYDADAYTAAQDESFTAFRSQKERLFKQLPWIQTSISDVQVMQGPGYWVTWFNQYYRAPNMTTEGIRRLYWQPDKKGEYRIVGMEWVPADVGMEANYLETVSPQVTAFVEKWRKAWERGDVKNYIACYAGDAEQAPRKGAASIRQQKQELWRKAKPAKVQLKGLRIEAVAGGVRADMTQDYRDVTGYSDRGVKTLLLRQDGQSWEIVKEEWSPAAR
uniref:ErfK/YbiS/YcfS/YnhG family protein n=1 Tax=Nitratidesulfovibrio vulgaris (strain DSM 19637 / Miyazaki F) TaxID=883 RepID=B8DLP2_NITV9